MNRLTLASVMDYRIDMRHCRRLLRSGSRSFFVSSWLLPAFYRGPATALYAFCRVADDIIDEGDDRDSGLEQLHERLDRIYAGEPWDDPVDRSLTGIVQRFDMPDPLLRALLEGFQWDRDEKRYANLSELYGYAARVAGTVGVMMAVLMGVRSAGALARASDLGVAMQLTNIARDVGEDARAGRVYLPLEWLVEAGIDPDEFLADPQYSEALAAVIQRLLDDAEVLYDRAVPGIRALPGDCQAGIFAARSIYREIGRDLQRTGLDSVNQRAVVSHTRKLALLRQALMQARRPEPTLNDPPLEETRFLVEAAARRRPVNSFFAAS
jgi:phytoene synthase